MMKAITSLLSALLLALPLSSRADVPSEDQHPVFHFGTPTRPDGRMLTVDSRGMRLDDVPFIPVMGEIHYTRVPECDWQRELRKMKAGGISVVATYVFWIHHEFNEGEWCWVGNHNLRRFVELCKEEGLMVVLRLGPFCHGEVYQGGFPTWVLDKQKANPDYKIRSTSPGFLKDTRSLYQHIFQQVDGLLWKQGGPIVGVQLENECRGPWPYYAALKEMAVELGYDVPFYTRTGWPALTGKEVFGQMLPLFGDYADGFWDRKLTDMPGSYAKAFQMQEKRMSENIATETFTADQLREGDDVKGSGALQYPYLTCELGGGMMTSYHRRINMSGRELKALAVCKLGSGSNLPGYYMYHGGTNPIRPEHTMGETQASQGTNHNDVPIVSYDFQAPLGEVGQPNLTSYTEARLLHYFLQSFGAELSQSDVDSISPTYARRGSFEFHNDYVRIQHEEGKAYITLRDYRLPNGGAINWTSVEPVCRLGNTYYFQEIPGIKPDICFEGQVLPHRPHSNTYVLRKDGQPDIIAKVLPASYAPHFYLVDGHITTARYGQLLYSTPDGLVEEAWLPLEQHRVEAKLTKKAGPAREVPMGRQKVAAQPSDEDFQQAATWQLILPDMLRLDNKGVKARRKATSKNAAKFDASTCLVETRQAPFFEPLGGDDVAVKQTFDTLGLRMPDDVFLDIHYRGDAARLYADGKLVQDNFWNGKPMHVRLSDIAKAKTIELRILPLRHDAPIYLQAEQRKQLEPTAPSLYSGSDNNAVTLCLDAINVVGRATVPCQK